MPTGLEKTVRHPHISLMILGARFQFINWSSEIHVMGLTKIGNNHFLHIIGKLTVCFIQGNQGVHCLCEWTSKWAMDNHQKWNICRPPPTWGTVQSTDIWNLLSLTCCGTICEIQLYQLLWKQLCFAIHWSIRADRYSKTLVGVLGTCPSLPSPKNT